MESVAKRSEDVERRLIALLEESGALRRGHFRLSSGLHSTGYVQCALLLEEPGRASRVARWLAERLRKHAPDSVVSPALGGLIIGYQVAAELDCPFRFVERRDGELELRRGFELRRGERVALVEDVVTTGLSLRETAAVVEAGGAMPVACGALILRRETELPCPVEYLARLDIPTYESSGCPLCAAGSAPSQPGSRGK